MKIEGSVSSNRLISYTLMFLLCLALLTVFSGCATPLGSAARRGDLNTVRTLIENGADVNEKGSDKYTALNHAVISGQTEVVRLLIERGADIEGNGAYWTPLESAASEGNVNMVRFLLDAGANVKGSSNNGPLHLAVWLGHTEVARMLIDAGADIEESDVKLAQNKGYRTMARMLERALEERYSIGNKSASFAIKPAPKVEKRPAKPSQNWVWKPGDWRWNGNRWIWRSGYWKRNRYSQERTASVPATTTPSWINQKVQERGTAVIDTTRYQSSAKARVWARRAAQSEAQRRLIDLVLTLRLDSQTTIRDVLTRDDSDFRLGMIRRVYYVDQDSNDTVYAVTLGLNLNDVYSYMREKGIYFK